MSDMYELLGKCLSQEILPYFEKAQSFQSPIYHSVQNCLELSIQIDHVLPFEVYRQTCHELKLALHTDIDLRIQAQDPKCTMSDLDLYVERIVAHHHEYQAFTYLHPFMENEVVCFATNDESRLAQLKRGLPQLEKALETYGISMDFVCRFREDEEEIETKEIALPKIAKPVVSTPKNNKYLKDVVFSSIGDLRVGMRSVAIEGHIFSVENRLLKSKRTLQELYISDYQDAIVAKRFEGKRCSIDEINAVKNGQTVRLTGEVVYDNYSKCDSFMISKLEVIPAKKREDTSKEKRIEWHVHSNFSEMDGVAAIENYIQTAYDWGMEAVGVCDHDVVQAFPFAQHKVEALTKQDPNRHFQMLYGCEMNMIDTHFQVVTNNDHRPLEQTTIVSFDLETTGLSQRLDKIIEFGAVKMVNREVVDRKQLFINPQMAIPADISNLTHITQKDVENEKPIDQVLDELLDWIGDAVLVAHNGSFDLGFMNAACRACGKPEMTNPMIDTLPLAQLMMDMKGYRLGAVCRHYGVAYDGEGAHRADYDAEVLSRCFCCMWNEWGSDATLDTLEHISSTDKWFKKHPSHITVFAKNKAGLKELFELVTMSHTKYLAYNKNSNSSLAHPRIVKHELKKYHEKGNLLFGTSCQNGEIFDLAHTRSEAELETALSFYDYVEIQPLDCYRNLLDRHAIHSVEDLKKILHFIIDKAEEMGIPVIASSDAHYVEPHDKRIRDIYINAKAIGGQRHPLYVFNAQKRKMSSAPNQHLRTTDEMLKEMSWLGEEKAYEYVIANPKHLKEMCDEIFPIHDKLYPPEIEGSDQKLRDICFKTAHEMYGNPLPDIVEKRLTRELDSIIGHGYYVVYYISHLLVKKSNDDGYIVGSRGSVGSSFAATMSGITEVNPLIPHYYCPHCHHYEFLEEGTVSSGFDLPDKECPVCHHPMKGDGQDIPFETFLGFEGDKVPDIDLNFSGDYQPVAHNYCKEVFGADHAFRAGTVGTVAEKTAYGYVKGYEEEMEIEPFPDVKRHDLAKSCEGVKRTTGQHPAGIIVVPEDMDIHDFTPVQYPANDPHATWLTTHFDFHQIHDNILKFDILGHVDPTAMKMLENITGINVTTLPMNDKETMAIFSSVESLHIDTTRYDQITGAAGIPEFGTPFVRGILEKTRPTTFSELVTISGLSHGTDVWLGNAESLIDAGTCKLSEVIGCRDDIMVQLMGYGMKPKLAFQIMEFVRKGRGLKDEWIKEMKACNVPDWFIDSCLKIKYMFPKAHAVAYVMMAVRIAWFKVHRPIAYYCMFFSIRCDAYDIATMISGEQAIRQKMTEIKKKEKEAPKEVTKKDRDVYSTLELALEMFCRGYRFSNMSITRSDATDFIQDPDDEKSIIPPFTALDGLGANVGRSIVKARNERPFLSKEDLINRTQLSSSLLKTMDSMGVTEGLDEENQMTLF